MSLDAKLLAKVKTKYEAGEKVRKISEDLGVSTSAITKNAKRHGWEHGVHKAEIAQTVEKKVRAELIENDVARATAETEKYLKDTEILRNYTLQVLGKILSNRDDKGQVDFSNREVADTLFTYLKIGKIATETLSLSYQGKRKALRMDEAPPEEMLVLPWED